MPTHDFRCSQCDVSFEERVPFGGEKPACPHCGLKDTVEKQIAAPGIIFKGSGFYVTDRDAEKSRPQPQTVEQKSTESKPENKNSSSATVNGKDEGVNKGKNKN